ncbi:10167_t:CDS:2 [Funneliformis geosporum]|nr:10167_t:CDS:2 [Funneliformis geosporum]
MVRPISPEFDLLTYSQYFKRYLISPSRPLINQSIFHDQLNNYVKLHLTIPAKDESNYRIGPNRTYRQKFLSLFPNFLTTLQIQITNNHHSHIIYLNNHFAKMLDRLLQSLHQELSTTIQDIIRLQLENIKMLLHLLPETAILDLPEDQYYVLSTISSYFGPNDGIK